MLECIQSQPYPFYDPFRPLEWRLFGMLLGFFDDSGKESDPSNKIVCAAGYIAAGATFWNSFHEIWRNALLQYGLDQLHMKDLMFAQSAKEPYAGWDWQKKKAVLETFSNAIKATQLVGFGVAVDAEAWRELPREYAKTQGTVQEFCFTRLIKMIVGRIKISVPGEKIAIMFDCDQGFTPARFQRYLAIREKYPEDGDHLVSFGVGEPTSYMPLQAADFLAWETRTHILRQMKGHAPRPEFEHMMSVLPGFFPDYASEYWTREHIEKQLRDIPTPAV
jgi:hypothetical protein